MGGKTVDRSRQLRCKQDAVRWASKTETGLRRQRVFRSTQPTVEDAIERYLDGDLLYLAPVQLE